MTEYTFKTPPFEHQRRCYEDTRDLEYWGLLFEQRCGKSKVFIDTAGHLFCKGRIQAALVIAPKETTRAWVDEQLPGHLNVPHRVLRWRGIKTKARKAELDKLFMADLSQLTVLVMNVEALSNSQGDGFKVCQAFLKKYRCLTGVDESSVIGDEGSQRTQNVNRLANLSPYRRILTGTPVVESPMKAFSQFAFLSPRILGSSFPAFKAQYAVLEEIYVTKDTKRKVIKEYKNLDRLQERMRTASTRVLRADCFDLPPKLYYTHTVEISDEAAAAYTKVADEERLYLESVGEVFPELAITRSMRLRMLASEFVQQVDVVDGKMKLAVLGSKRIDSVVKLVGDLDGKVIVWCHFRNTGARLLEALRRAYGDASGVVIASGAKEAERAGAAVAFREDKTVKWLLSNPAVGGYGLDLSSADNVVYAEHDWPAERRVQSEDRAVHPLKKSSIAYYDVIAPGTLDGYVRAVERGKEDIGNLVTGVGWRGLFAGFEKD